MAEDREALIIRPLDAGLRLHYRPPDAGTAQVVEEAANASRRLLNDTLGLPTPEHCRLYVMTSWWRFFLDSAPIHWLPLMALLSPLWAFRARRSWSCIGGWMMPYGGRQAVGIKPPRLLLHADRRLGERIFIREDDADQKIRAVTCHELTHAFTARLRLPMWLQEGVAMNAVDLLFGTPTVRPDTLDLLDRNRRPARPRSVIRLDPANPESSVYNCVQGYWITRLFVECDLQFLRGLLQARMPPGALEARVAAALGLGRHQLWFEVNRFVLAHFRGSSSPVPTGHIA